MILARLVPAMAILAGFALAQSLDYDSYKKRVEPIFSKKRAGHARCVSCHSAANNRFRLQPLPEGATWSDEQSKKNFEAVSKIVKVGDVQGSALLIHPLAPEAGGDEFHSGGRQFLSKDDADWKAIAEWVRTGK